MANPYEFKSRADYGKWNSYAEQCRSIVGMSELQVSETQAAIRYLSASLGGDAWLAEAVRNGHPLVRYLISATAWSKAVLVRIAQSMEALSGAIGFDGLLKGLRSTRRFSERQSVLDAAYRFHSVGFQVAFDPVVQIAKDGCGEAVRSPDIKLLSRTGEELFVEVSALGRTDEREGISRISTILWSYLLDDVMRIKGMVVRALFCKALIAVNDNELRNILSQLDERIEQLKQEDSFGTFERNGLIEVAIGPPRLSGLVEAWAKERGIEESQIVWGPAITLNDLKRLVLDKVGKKARQLPKNRGGIIIVTATSSLLFQTYETEVIAATLAEYVQRWPSLICMMVTHCHGDERQNISCNRSTMEYVIVEKVLAEPLWERSVIVFNKACEIAAGRITLESIRHALCS